MDIVKDNNENLEEMLNKAYEMWSETLGTPENAKWEKTIYELTDKKLKKDQILSNEKLEERTITNEEIRFEEERSEKISEAREGRFWRIMSAIGKTFEAITGVGSFLILLDYEADRSISSKAWPVVQDKLFPKKNRH